MTEGNADHYAISPPLNFELRDPKFIALPAAIGVILPENLYAVICIAYLYAPHECFLIVFVIHDSRYDKLVSLGNIIVV